MWPRFRRITLGFSFACLVVLAGSHFAVKRHLEKNDFKAFAEVKLSELLKTEIRIGEIRLRPFFRIVLSDIEAKSGEGADKPFSVAINRIAFRYQPLSFFSEDFKLPSTIVFDAPNVMFDGARFLEGFLEGQESIAGLTSSIRLKLASGQLEYEVPFRNSKISFQNISGEIKPAGDRKIYIDFRAQSRGILEGDVRVRGRLDREGRSHDLHIYLDSVVVSDLIPLPLKDLSGHVHLKGESLRFDDLKLFLHGWETHVSGALANLFHDPILDINVRFGKGQRSHSLSLVTDFAGGRLIGHLFSAEQLRFVFDGSIAREDLKFSFDDLNLNDVYQGSGFLDFESGQYRFLLENDKQRIQGVSNLKGLYFDLNVELNHVLLNGLDLVTSAHIKLEPTKTKWANEDWGFDGEFETDYFLLEFTPLDDFRGVFKVSSDGVRDLRASWGNAFRLDGNMSFEQSGLKGRLDLSVNGFDLSEVKDFASKPLPRELRGVVTGKLTLDGAFEKPEVMGDFIIKEGLLGQLEYDRAVIHLRGFPPYLPLNDSRIVLGRSTLYLKGALDLELDNMFHGVRMQTGDKLVVWKGLTLNTSSEDGGLELDSSFMNLPRLRLTVGEDGVGQAGAGKDDAQQDKYVKLGPTLSF